MNEIETKLDVHPNFEVPDLSDLVPGYVAPREDADAEGAHRSPRDGGTAHTQKPENQTTDSPQRHAADPDNTEEPDGIVDLAGDSLDSEVDGDITASDPAESGSETLLGTVTHQTHDLRAVYYDTEDLRLVRSGVTVRYRNEDGTDVWHLKLPTGDGPKGALTRREYSFDGSRTKLPEQITSLVTPYARGKALVRVGRIRTKRNSTLILDHDGEVLAELCDDTVSVYDGRRLASRFREVEVESPKKKLRRRIVSRLIAAGATMGDQTPKIVRVLGPQAEAPPDIPPPSAAATGPSTPLYEVVSRALLTDLARMIHHEPGTRLGDVKELHQMRVATRRLRSTLKTFKPLLDPEWTDSLRGSLKDTASALGAVRDLDVLLGNLANVSLDSHAAEGLEELTSTLNRRRDRARRNLLATLDAPSHVELLNTLSHAAHNPKVKAPDAPAGPEMIPLAASAWKKVRSAHRNGADLHQLRIKIKRYRYAVEALIPVFGKDAARLSKKVGRAQDLLGELNDAVVAKETYRTLLTPTRSLSAAFTLGVLTGYADAAEKEAIATWSDGGWKSLNVAVKKADLR